MWEIEFLHGGSNWKVNIHPTSRQSIRANPPDGSSSKGEAHLDVGRAATMERPRKLAKPGAIVVVSSKHYAYRNVQLL